MARFSFHVRRLSGLTLLAAAAMPESALADVAPPPGYVESCTIGAHERPGLECQSCRAWHGDAQACSNSLGAQGYEHRCRTSGASVWSEVWCRPAGADTNPPPAPTPSPPDPALMSSPEPAAPVVTMAAPAEPVPGEPHSGPASPGQSAAVGPPPPGARGCGSCEAAADRSSLSLVGLIVSVAAVLSGAALRRKGRRPSAQTPRDD